VYAQKKDMASDNPLICSKFSFRLFC